MWHYNKILKHQHCLLKQRVLFTHQETGKPCFLFDLFLDQAERTYTYMRFEYCHLSTILYQITILSNYLFLEAFNCQRKKYFC